MALPVTILTGFLGGGKTTLLRRLLRSPEGRNLGILLNERGVSGIDDLAPDAAGFIELAGGCVCCVDEPDLVRALEGLARRGGLERVVLETSGLADPLPISWALSRPEVQGLVTLAAVVAVVDAANVEQTHTTEEWAAQVRAADVVVLSKLDLVGTAEAAGAHRRVREVSPPVVVLDGDEGLLALVGSDAIFQVPGGAARAGARVPPGAARPPARHGGFATVAVTSADEFDAEAVEDLAYDLPAEVFRAKAIVRVGGGAGDPGWLAFQAIGGRATVELGARAPAHGESRFLFFGRAVDGAVLRARIARCAIAAAAATPATPSVRDP